MADKENKSTLCENCGAEYINNGGWVMGYHSKEYETTVPDFIKVREIPKDVCPVCEE